MEWLTTLFRAFAKPFQWWIVVGPWERGLRIRLGKVAADLAPGIHFRIPFLDRIHLQSIRLRSIADSNHTAASRDHHTVTVGIAIDYSIVNLGVLFNILSSPEATLRFRAAAAIAKFVGSKDRQDITAKVVEDAVNEEIRTFGCGLGEIRARVTAFSFARTFRLLMNDYSSGAGLYHGYDREPGQLNS